MKVFVTMLTVVWLLCAGRYGLAAEVDYRPYQELLAKYVRAGEVDYLAWKKKDFPEFERYIQNLQKMSIADLNDDAEKAFWINAYNALTIYAVLKSIPENSLLAEIFSVQIIPGFFDHRTYNIAGEIVTLNDIEYRKLRKRFKDARIHFAIVCASRSCPEIQEAVFTAQDINRRLEQAARAFIQDKSKNRLDRKKNVLYLSQVFRWYGSDFIDDAGSVLNYIQKYLSVQDRQYLSRQGPRIKYLHYNWLLNIQRK